MSASGLIVETACPEAWFLYERHHPIRYEAWLPNAELGLAQARVNELVALVDFTAISEEASRAN